MINIEQLTEKDIGRGVIRMVPYREPEDGIITSFNSSYVFVKYKSSNQSQATKPEELVFLTGGGQR